MLPIVAIWFTWMFNVHKYVNNWHLCGSQGSFQRLFNIFKARCTIVHASVRHHEMSYTEFFCVVAGNSNLPHSISGWTFVSWSGARPIKILKLSSHNMTQKCQSVFNCIKIWYRSSVQVMAMECFSLVWILSYTLTVCPSGQMRSFH